MRLCSFSSRWLTLLLAAYTFSALRAHQDPAGDIYPAIVIEGGNFAVSFSSNTGRTGPNRLSYRMIFTPTGELLAPRHEIAETEGKKPQTSNPALALLPQMEGKSAVWRDTAFLFSHWFRLHHGRPDYVAATAGKAPIRRQLPWPDVSVNEVVTPLVDDTHITLLVTQQDDLGLYLYQFARESFEEPKSVRLGVPTHIYEFPGCSELVAYRDSFLVAWAEPTKTGARMVLDRWTPGTGEVQHECVSNVADWNTHIVMARIENHLLIAYHCLVPAGEDGALEGRWPRAKIYTIFRELR